jgi:hypothetical protein
VDAAEPAEQRARPIEAEEDNRRVPVDRRRRQTPMISRFLFRGRRKSGRRPGDEEFSYVDRPGGWILAAFTALVGLSVLDAWYTLDLLKKGATEANPVMRVALEISDEAFVVIKTVITVVGAGFLSLHKNWPLGRLCMILALLGYSILLFYHLWAQHAIRS